MAAHDAVVSLDVPGAFLAATHESATEFTECL